MPPRLRSGFGITGLSDVGRHRAMDRAIKQVISCILVHLNRALVCRAQKDFFA